MSDSNQIQRLLAPGEPGLDPITVLLVDDDEDCRSLVRDAIRETNGRVQRIVEFCDGHAAIEFLKQTDADSRPGLIFLDVEMPKLDGLSALEQIKAIPELRNIPVVMLTGVADDGFMERAARLGANSYTVKPAKPADFLDSVRTSTNYWLKVHQYPKRHLPQAEARR